MKTEKENPESFRPMRDVRHYLSKLMYDKSGFINKAIQFYILMLNDPEKIMIEMKKRYPEKWKYINRRKFL